MPDAIGPYTIVREIGRGGMGVVYDWAQSATLVKDQAFALALLQRSVRSGLPSPRALETTPLLDDLRGTAEFADVLARAREGHDAAAAAFATADGYRLLGLPRA